MKHVAPTVFRRIAALAIVASVFALMLPAGGNADTVTVSTDVQTTLTFGVDSGTIGLGNLTPGSPVTGTSVLTVDTNNAAGYYLSARYTTTDCSASTTLCHSDTTTQIADKTDFDGIGTCAVTATYSGTGLGFTVYAADTNKDTTCWGTGTTATDANDKYAGFPTANQTIHTVSAGPQTDDDTSVGYKLDVAASQKSGSYSGDVEYTATAN